MLFGMSELANRQCIPCKGGVPALEGAALDALIEQLGNGWAAVEGHHLEKLFSLLPFGIVVGFGRVPEIRIKMIRDFCGIGSRRADARHNKISFFSHLFVILQLEILSPIR